MYIIIIILLYSVHSVLCPCIEIFPECIMNVCIYIIHADHACMFVLGLITCRQHAMISLIRILHNITYEDGIRIKDCMHVATLCKLSIHMEVYSSPVMRSVLCI